MTLFGINFQQLLVNFGLIAAFLIIFSESCLLFFLPGDSFVFVAGILAAQGVLNVWVLLIVMVLAAVLGNSFGYWIGKVLGERLFRRNKKSVLFTEENLQKTHEFYAKHGQFTVVLARFIPVVRTFAPMVAGTAKMNYRVFAWFNLIGAVVWVAVIELLGYWAGNKIPNIDHYILPIIGIILILSILPGLYAVLKSQPKKK